jgi:hypothetical protein
MASGDIIALSSSSSRPWLDVLVGTHLSTSCSAAASPYTACSPGGGLTRCYMLDVSLPLYAHAAAASLAALARRQPLPLLRVLALSDCVRATAAFSTIPSRRCFLMSTHASILVDSVGPPSAEVHRIAASFP